MACTVIPPLRETARIVRSSSSTLKCRTPSSDVYPPSSTAPCPSQLRSKTVHLRPAVCQTSAVSLQRRHARTEFLPGPDVIKPRTLACLSTFHLVERDLGRGELVQDGGLVVHTVFMVTYKVIDLSRDELQGAEIVDGGKGEDIQQNVGRELQQHSVIRFTYPESRSSWHNIMPPNCA